MVLQIYISKCCCWSNPLLPKQGHVCCVCFFLSPRGGVKRPSRCGATTKSCHCLVSPRCSGSQLVDRGWQGNKGCRDGTYQSKVITSLAWVGLRQSETYCISIHIHPYPIMVCSICSILNVRRWLSVMATQFGSIEGRDQKQPGEEQCSNIPSRRRCRRCEMGQNQSYPCSSPSK